MKNIPHDVSIISGDNEEIQTNKYLLSVFSPILRNQLSSPFDTSKIVFLPDVSTFSIRNLLNIIGNGFSITEKISKEAMREITETVQLLSIDITELCNDENIPQFVGPIDDQAYIAKSQSKKRSKIFPKSSSNEESRTCYDESTESIVDALLKIFDDGNLSLIHI